MLEPKSAPVAGAAFVDAGFAPKLKPPVAGAAAAVAVAVFVVAALVVLLAPPPKEKPPEVPEKGLLAGGCENEKEADRPSVEPVEAAGVEPNIVAAAMLFWQMIKSLTWCVAWKAMMMQVMVMMMMMVIMMIMTRPSKSRSKSNTSVTIHRDVSSLNREICDDISKSTSLFCCKPSFSLFLPHHFTIAL